MDQILLPFLTYLSVTEKNWPLSRGYFGSWGHSLVAIAIVELFQQESMHGLSAGTKKVAVVERWQYSGGSTVVPQTVNC